MRDFLDPAAPAIARAFRTGGYVTAHYGKWHMGGGRDVDDYERRRHERIFQRLDGEYDESCAAKQHSFRIVRVVEVVVRVPTNENLTLPLAY